MEHHGRLFDIDQREHNVVTLPRLSSTRRRRKIMTLKALTPLPALVMMTAALMLPVPAAHAVPITFELNLSGANEVPPVSPAGTGSATVVLDPTAQTLVISTTFSGLTSNT